MDGENDGPKDQEQYEMQEMQRRQEDQKEIDRQFNERDRETDFGGKEFANDTGASTSKDLLGGKEQENLESSRLGNQRNRDNIFKLREVFGDIWGSRFRKTDNPNYLMIQELPWSVKLKLCSTGMKELPSKREVQNRGNLREEVMRKRI